MIKITIDCQGVMTIGNYDGCVKIYCADMEELLADIAHLYKSILKKNKLSYPIKRDYAGNIYIKQEVFPVINAEDNKLVLTTIL